MHDNEDPTIPEAKLSMTLALLTEMVGKNVRDGCMHAWSEITPLLGIPIKTKDGMRVPRPIVDGMLDLVRKQAAAVDAAKDLLIQIANAGVDVGELRNPDTGGSMNDPDLYRSVLEHLAGLDRFEVIAERHIRDAANDWKSYGNHDPLPKEAPDALPEDL